jgi:hypothetical protein
MCTVEKLIFRYYRRNADVSKPDVGDSYMNGVVFVGRQYSTAIKQTRVRWGLAGNTGIASKSRVHSRQQFWSAKFMARRSSQPPATPPDLSPERAHAALSKQLDLLQQKLKGHDCLQVEAEETEWTNFTEKLIIRAFGSASANLHHFFVARNAGEHSVVPYGASFTQEYYQNNFNARIQAFEPVLRGCLSELAIDLPEAELKGAYAPGEEYEFYKDVKYILQLAQKDVLIVDPYIDSDMFELYAGALSRAISFRLLSTNVPAPVSALATKYAAGGNFQFRHSTRIHDRMIFGDSRVWVVGQSLKDAAKKKPTYIVEADEPLMRIIYEDL